jgi:SAM domain (Sterile alpha motif)
VDVGVWLGNLGLGRYEAAFRENAIDGDVLLRLNPDDLKDLGVTIVGHRRKLLDAIAALNSSPSPRSFRPPCIAAVDAGAKGRGGRRRTSSGHGHVLRSGRFDSACVAARRRGLAQSG